MSALQWALLVLSVVIIVAIVAMSRRERPPRIEDDRDDEPNETKPEGSPQLDIFAAQPPREDVEAGSPGFDEFGVGKARRRQAPLLLDDDYDMPPPAPPAPADAPRPLLGDLDSTPLPQSQAPLVPEPVLDDDDALPELDEVPADEPRTAPAFLRSASAAAPTPEPAPAPRNERIVTLLIASGDGTPILGPKIHTALKSQGLQFGTKQIYHRMAGERPVFSVASLVKPGLLVPEDAQRFSTPGLSVFMVLPGPVQPVVAMQDMMTTAQALGRALNAEVFDSRKQPLTAEVMRELQNDVEAWWKATA